ncbi:MAG: YeaH/YhbH family protein [Caulobacterales bacterium]
MNIIDRRLNPGGKSISNRQRFLRRARTLIRQAVRQQTGGRSIKDIEQGGEIVIPSDGVREPTLKRARDGGTREYVLPGNKRYVEGDGIARPDEDGGGGSGGSGDGDGIDEFRFVLSAEEFLDLFLEDLELPDLAKRKLASDAAMSFRRAGFSTSGSPSSLDVPRTMRNAMARRMALKRPKREDVEALAAEIAALEQDDPGSDQLPGLRETHERLSRRARIIPFIDPLDVRYRRLEPTPKPIAQAVMFCLMDVSGSMTEHMKDLAKRFYSLLYIFLRKRYPRVEVVFIRHTHHAEEVDEKTFFNSPETGGTVVSTALEEMVRVVAARFPAADWNIYAAQASDGDNLPSDNAKTAALLETDILPLCQYYAYLEVGSEEEPLPGFGERPSALWRLYSLIRSPEAPMAMRKVRHRRDIYPVFRDLFKKQDARAKQGS